MKPLNALTVSLEGRQLIEASAGTGKTYTITNLFLRLVVERGLTVDQILVVTFTNAATAELRDRIRRRLHEALCVADGQTAGDATLQDLAARWAASPEAARRLRQALRDVDRAAVFTIHGFCQRVLREHAFETAEAFDVQLLQDVGPLIVEAAQDFWTRSLTDAPLVAFQYVSRWGVTPRELAYLVRVAVAWPDMPVVGGETRPALAIAPYLEARRDLAAEWPESRDAVTKLLYESPALNRIQYRTTSVSRWLEQLDRLAATTDESLEGWFDELARLTPEAIARGTKNKYAKVSHPFFQRCADLVAAYGQLAADLEAWRIALLRDVVRFARKEVDARMRAERVQSFDDLLVRLRAALRGSQGEALRQRIQRDLPAALIDEFHDTDPIQYEIFRSLYGERGTLFLIGDPKQAIYAFRGADVFAYMQAAENVDARWTLDTNYRSDPSVVHAVNVLFEHARTPFLFDTIRFHPVKARPDARDRFRVDGAPAAGLEIVFVGRATGDGKPAAPSAMEVPALVAGELSQLLAGASTLDGRRVEPGDIAVLTRTNKEAHRIQAELRRLGIPAVLHGDSSVLESEEAPELAFVLRALAEPGNGSALKAALATSLFGLNANELFDLSNDETWERWVGAFYRWNDIWNRQGFVQSIRTLFREEAVAPRILGQLGGERKWTNYLHLIELCHAETTERRLGITGLLQWYDEARGGQREGIAPEAQQIRLESDDHAVQLTTMHRSKGLEYPIVYCPYLWRGRLQFSSDERYLKYHDPTDGNRLKLDLRAKEDKTLALELAEREALAENLRLAYVALTRAKHRCVVLWGRYRDAETSPLGHLLHPSPEVGPFDQSPATRVGMLDDRTLLAELHEVAAKSGGTLAVRPWIPTPPIPFAVRGPTRPRRLASRTPTRTVRATYRLSSFTSLVNESAVSTYAVQGRDVDSAAVEGDPVTSPAGRGETVTLSDFPKGARAGELIHSILEDLDFTETEEAPLAALVDRALERYGFSVATWGPVLRQGLVETLDTELASGLRLRDLSRRQRLNELEFFLPAALGAAPAVMPSDVAAALSLGGTRALPARYLETVANLGFSPLSGFLRGYVDLVFEHRGQFFVVDYKSNHLGPLPEDYAPHALIRPMSEHHYYLQYHLYTVALDRYLQQRLRGYDYERHFGGVFYLFLRGLSPSRGAGTGVFFDRPPRERITLLKDLLLPEATAP